MYSQFYDKSFRGDIKKKFFSSKKQCRNTSMIEESMRYIISPNKAVMGGRMTRKRINKKTKKQKGRRRNKSRRRQ